MICPRWDETLIVIFTAQDIAVESATMAGWHTVAYLGRCSSIPMVLTAIFDALGDGAHLIR